MNKSFDPSFYKHLLDIIPYPLIVISRDELLIKYLNVESEFFFSNSSSFLFNKELEYLLGSECYFLSYLKKLSNQSGTFELKQLPIKGKVVDKIKCIIPDDLKNYFFIIFQNKNIIDDYSDFENTEFNFLDETMTILLHEINNPLSSIKMATQILEKNIHKSDAEVLNIIKKETERVILLLQKISVPDSSILSISSKKENIHEIIRYSIFKIRLKRQKIKIIEQFDPSLPDISCDKDLISQVFENIFINALESSKFNENSYLKIETKIDFGPTVIIPNISKPMKKNYIYIRIIDNGFGIPKKNLKKVFLPFFTTKKSGSGIGMYLVKKIINTHNGHIAVNSDKNYTEIIIKLPI